MSGRYKVRCDGEGVFVYDAIDGGNVAGPMSWDSATRHAAACNSKKPPPAAPPCDCARYRTALEIAYAKLLSISRIGGFKTSTRLVLAEIRGLVPDIETSGGNDAV